jgi:hypothetical protein
MGLVLRAGFELAWARWNDRRPATAGGAIGWATPVSRSFVAHEPSPEAMPLTYAVWLVAAAPETRRRVFKSGHITAKRAGWYRSWKHCVYLVPASRYHIHTMSDPAARPDDLPRPELDSSGTGTLSG